MKKIAKLVVFMIPMVLCSCGGNGGTTTSGSTYKPVVTTSRAPEPDHYQFHDKQKFNNFWEDDYIYNESITLIEHEDGRIYADLFYMPYRIDKIQNYALDFEYNMSNFEINGRRIYLKEDIYSVPYVAKKYANPQSVTDKMPGVNYDPLEINGKYVLYTENKALVAKSLTVSYQRDTSSTWEIAKPQSQIDKLPKLKDKLQNGKTINLLTYGDSITEGLWSSGYFGTAPYLPTFAESFKREISRRYSSEVNFHNTAYRGWRAIDGLQDKDGNDRYQENVLKYNPDLLFIGFGMNDSSTTKDVFKTNIKTMIDRARGANPNVEFVLCSSSTINPINVNTSNHLDELKVALTELTSEYTGIAFMDMTAYSKYLLTVKDSFSLFANNYHHPNDFLTRAYVSVFMETIKTETAYVAPDDYIESPELDLVNDKDHWKLNGSGSTIENTSKGIKITEIGGLGANYRFLSGMKLDGLSFDFYGPQETNLQNTMIGFYFFGTDSVGTVKQDTVGTPIDLPFFSSWQCLFGGYQTRFAIKRSYSYQMQYSGDNISKCYKDVFKTTRGLSSNCDEQICLNPTDTAEFSGFNFKFEKVDESTMYKVTIKCMQPLHPHISHYNADTSTNTVITYIDSAEIPEFDQSSGRVYMYLCGASLVKSGRSDQPTIYLENLVAEKR